LWWENENQLHQDKVTGAVGRRASAVAAATSWTQCVGGGDGDLITALAADGATTLYSYVRVSSPRPGPRGEDLTCDLPVTKGGGVYSAVSGARIAGVPPSIALAVSGRLLAVIPLDPSARRHELRGAANGHIDVFDLRNDKLSTTVTVEGTATAIAVSQRVLAVLSSAAGGFRISRFDPRSGKAWGDTPVPADIDQHLSASGTRLVYRMGKRIWMMDARSGRRTQIATAAATPIGLSIDGHRVGWAENVQGRGRIVMLTLD
jgi:hypothetical protein